MIVFPQEVSEIRIGDNNVIEVYLGVDKVFPSDNNGGGDNGGGNNDDDTIFEGDKYIGDNIKNHPYYNEYFTVEALEKGTLQLYNVQGVYSNMYYSLNDSSWKSMGSTKIEMNAGDKVRMRKNVTAKYANSNGLFQSMPKCKIYGNINSLYAGDNFTTKVTPYNSMFQFWFFGNLNVVDAENLVFPYTTVTSNFAESMFDECTNLVKAPIVLPSLTTANYCYYGFVQSTSVEKAPVLPAESVANYAYQNMLRTLPNIKYVKCLAKEFGTKSTDNWLYKSSDKGTFVKAKNSEWSRDTSGIPSGWTVIDA